MGGDGGEGDQDRRRGPNAMLARFGVLSLLRRKGISSAAKMSEQPRTRCTLIAPGIGNEVAASIAHGADAMCPYSRGNQGIVLAAGPLWIGRFVRPIADGVK